MRRTGADAAAMCSLCQTVTIHGKAGEKFFFGAWAWANSAGLREDRSFSMRVETKKSDGSGTEVLGEFSFNSTVRAWQLGADVFTLPYDADSVTLVLSFDHQVDMAAFDGVQLSRILWKSPIQ